MEEIRETKQESNNENIVLSEESATENSTQSEEIKNTEKKKSKLNDLFKAYFSPLRITYLALFTALSFIMRLPVFEFPIIPAVPFLKVDFSNTFALIAGFALGPVAGVIVGVLKEIIYALSFSQSVGIGEIANILMMLPYVLIPAIIYKKKKGIKVVLISVVIACIATIILSIPINYLLTFPFYLKIFTNCTWASGMNAYITKYWYWAVLFNFVKTVLISVAVMILYKPLSKLIKLTNKKFSKIKSNRKKQQEIINNKNK